MSLIILNRQGFLLGNKKVYIKSFGCQMNKLDTVLAANALKAAGFGEAESIDEADIVLINTCSVRGHAEERVFSHLGHLKHIKESRPELVVAVMGCMAQRLGGKLLEHKAVDVVCGPGQIPNIVEMLKEATERKEKVVLVAEEIREVNKDGRKLDEFEADYDREDNLPGQAFVSVMRGCNNFCSYCIVPYVRGPEVSREPTGIIEQVKRLAGQGVKLVTLLGQAVNFYEYKNGAKMWCLADILEKCGEVEGIEWIRFVTSYPREKYFDRICAAMRDNPKVCRYLHIPAQSGSDRILKAMNRHYTAGEYLSLLERARSLMPDIEIAGDFIVGFPGETQEDFEATIGLVKKAEYKNAFIFKYSPRAGTRAEKTTQDDISGEVKAQRNRELLAIQEEISGRLSGRFLGKKVRVLVEGLSKKAHLNDAEGGKEPQLIGRTGGDWIVVFNGPQSLAGAFTTVKITKTSPLTLFGQLE